MLGVNAKQLTKLLKAQNETTKQSNQIANQLIKELEVQNGFGLAGFLEVDTNFDNFTAMRVWTYRQIKQFYDGDFPPDYDFLKRKLTDIVPESV
ncbi:hypothetical protein H9W84_11935 [Moraxella sp. PS-22]|uniref:Uncharacterized protein n=1 Tax=Moraxella tetraodonis TaxID=2767221 RepID=A0A9X1UTF2_9GAMM|nr:hypothetical protein [Moraxella tetraodonis]MCG8148813.1 hypothetical protein [Moraxella tetraodonis]